MAKNGTVGGLSLKDFSKKPVDSLQALTSDGKYFKFETPGTYNFICTGLDDFQKDGKTVDVVCFEDAEGQKLVNGSAVLVSSVKDADKEFPFFIRIDYKGKKSGANGDYDDMQVYCL